MMTFREFHNGLRILLNLDRQDLVDAGVIRPDDHNAWGDFRRNPFRWFIQGSDTQAEKLWVLMQKRGVR